MQKRFLIPGVLCFFALAGCGLGFNDRQTYLRDLRAYAAYTQESVNLPAFTYAASSEAELAKLRARYGLAQVAGDGDELSRIVNLMLWVHRTLRHDGRAKNPFPTDAQNIIRSCLEEKKKVNCRMFATVLNEACLAMGYPARHITCLPNGENFKDCHVINIVYAKTLDKWVYMDPTFAVCVQDGSGNYLSIEEVRARMIGGEELYFKEGPDWNGVPLSKRSYESYMMKNLFRFSCPLRSECGYETKTADKIQIHLNPKGYDPYGGKTAAMDKQGYTVTRYYISNPAFFWGPPVP